tara:strand:- start:6899 stop:8242 length:1344 start_codon:yes stop_codon:yes gene_type:complete
MASTRITRTPSSAGNRNKWTISMWLKRGKMGSTNRIFSVYQNASYSTEAYFNGSDAFVFFDYYNGGYNGRIITSRVFRDPSAWYHIVINWDKDNGTTADKLILWVNGVRETNLSTDDAPSNASTWNVDGQVHEIGSHNNGDFYDGLMSHVQFVDGLSLPATTFGAVDATTGEWKVGTASYGTPGTNGFHLKMEDSSNMDLDSSSNAHTFATAGTLSLSQDCPSNNFATINRVQVEGGGSSALTFANGNTKVTRSGNWRGHMSSIGANKGKWYWEVKCTGNIALGIAKFGGDADSWAYLAGGQSWLGDKNDVWILYNNASTQVKYTGGSDGGSWGTVTGDGEIVMIAFDADNGIIWTGNGGTWHESATEAEIEAGTTTNAMYSGITIGTDFFGSVGAVENGNLEYNFGDGYFGTTAVSSAGTNASGFGIFEYDVPAGFTALCTKGLNE